MTYIEKIVYIRGYIQGRINLMVAWLEERDKAIAVAAKELRTNDYWYLKGKYDSENTCLAGLRSLDRDIEMYLARHQDDPEIAEVLNRLCTLLEDKKKDGN